MKLKKFFAGVLAAAMMLTVGATAAFATAPDKISVPKDENNKSEAKMFTQSDDDLELTKTLTVVEGTAPNSMDFSFTVVKQGTATAIDGAASDAKFTTTDANPFVGPNKEYTATTTVQLATVLGTDKETIGEYYYTITENTPAYPGVTPVHDTLTMKITVVNATGEIGGGYGYYVALYRSNSDGTTEKVEAKNAFSNTYNSKNLTLSKTVHGSLGSLAENFSFIIKFEPASADVADMYKGPQVGTVGNDVSINGKTTGDYLDLNTPYTVTLKHGKSLNFSNLPAGIKYKVYEVDSAFNDEKDAVTKGDYTVVVRESTDVDSNVIAFDTTDKNTVKGSVGTANVTTAFHNTHEGQPDMGVVLDNAPYIAMLAIVAIGGVALMLNKRRRDEE